MEQGKYPITKEYRIQGIKTKNAITKVYKVQDVKRKILLQRYTGVKYRYYPSFQRTNIHTIYGSVAVRLNL